MDDIIQVLWMWRNEAIVILAIPIGLLLLRRAGKAWNTNVSLTAILGAGLIGAALPLYFGWNFGISPRAIFCILLYIWCVFGMLFLAAGHTHFVKLLLGLATQAGVVYTLFRLI